LQMHNTTSSSSCASTMPKGVLPMPCMLDATAQLKNHAGFCESFSRLLQVSNW
jgi:hypothetical protein